MKKIMTAGLSLALAVTTALSVGCGGVDSDFSGDYVMSALDASYKGDYDQYISMTDSTEDAATELYNNTVDYYASVIAYYCEVSTDDISEDLYAQYVTLAQQLLSQARYKVSTSESGKESCYVTLAIQPIQILEQANDDVQSCVDAYNEELSAYDEEALLAMSDEEYAALEETYATNILSVLNDCAENLTYGDTVTFTMEISIDEDGYYAPANDDDWNTIDDYIMGLS